MGGTLSKAIFFESSRAGSPSPSPPLQRVSSSSSESSTDADCEEGEEDELKAVAHDTDFVKSSCRYGKTGMRAVDLEVFSEGIGGTLHFMKFETARMSSFWKLIKEKKLLRNVKVLPSTGGGAYKYQVRNPNLY